jgi:hypothetical protein
VHAIRVSNVVLDASFWSSGFNPLKPKLVKIIVKNSVRTSKRTQHFAITRIDLLMLFKVILPVYTDNRTNSYVQNSDLQIVKVACTRHVQEVSSDCAYRPR